MSTPPDRSSAKPEVAGLYAAMPLIVMALLSPWVVAGAIGALRSTSNDPRQWLPRDFDETDKQDWFQDRFGIDENAVVSWPGCTLDDRRVEDLARVLEKSPLFDRVRTGPRVLRQLTSPLLKIPRSEALRRIRGTLVGADRRTTCLILEISAAGQADRTSTVEHIVRTAQAECNLSRESLRMGGPTVDAAEIDRESRRLLVQLAGLSAVVSLVIAGLRFKSARLAAMLLVGAVYSTGLSLAVLYYSGGTMNLLMTMLPPLVYVLTISAGVHLVNYYRDAIAEVGLRGAARRAVALGWLPCSLAAGTTAAGLLSLATSKIVPIQQFGIYSAVGTLLSIAVLLVYLPSALRLFPAVVHERRPDDIGIIPPDRSTELRTKTAGYLARITRFHAAVLLACLVVMGLFGLGLTRIKSTVKLQHRFTAGSKIISDYRWLEEHLGPLVPLEVVVRFGHDCPLKFHQRMRFVDNVERKINSLGDVEATLSAVAFVPLGPRAGGVRRRPIPWYVDRALFHRRLADRRDSLIETHFLAEDRDEQLWRISVQASALGNLDYGRFTDTLQQAVQPLLTGAATRHIEATYTGIIPLIYKAQRQLLNDLVRSFFTAFVVIAVMMVFMLRSLRAGMVAMVPNLFPVMVIFGAMGWLGVLVQIGSVMTASAALGIAVDDTVHFLTWFRRGLGERQSRQRALETALERCAGAMILTTLICGSGLAVFGLSSFVPILHFAWLMVTLLITALVSDLVLLPALLAGPLGRIFERRTSS